jgi:hypothetical protein
VRESEERIETLPETLKKDHPKGGFPVALGISGATLTFANHIKASRALL